MPADTDALQVKLLVKTYKGHPLLPLFVHRKGCPLGSSGTRRQLLQLLRQFLAGDARVFKVESVESVDSAPAGGGEAAAEAEVLSLLEGLTVDLAGTQVDLLSTADAHFSIYDSLVVVIFEVRLSAFQMASLALAVGGLGLRSGRKGYVRASHLVESASGDRSFVWCKWRFESPDPQIAIQPSKKRKRKKQRRKRRKGRCWC